MLNKFQSRDSLSIGLDHFLHFVATSLSAWTANYSIDATQRLLGCAVLPPLNPPFVLGLWLSVSPVSQLWLDHRSHTPASISHLPLFNLIATSLHTAQCTTLTLFKPSPITKVSPVHSLVHVVNFLTVGLWVHADILIYLLTAWLICMSDILLNCSFFLYLITKINTLC